MGLENLKSIFKEGFNDQLDNFVSNVSVFDSDSRIDSRPRPTLDSVLRGREYKKVRFSKTFENNNLFVKPENYPFQDSLFLSDTFDPRAPFAKEGTLYLSPTFKLSGNAFMNTNNLEVNSELFIENSPQNKFDTKFTPSPPTPDGEAGNFRFFSRARTFGTPGEPPTGHPTVPGPVLNTILSPLDNLLRGKVYEQVRFSNNFSQNRQFVNDINDSNHPFLAETFDPRAGLGGLIKEGTTYRNGDRTLGSLQYGAGGFRQNTTFNSKITDFSTAAGNNDTPFTPLSQLGLSFYNGEANPDNLSWQTLYNENHTPKDNPGWEAAGLTPVNYGPNVGRDRLNIRKNNFSMNTMTHNSRTALLGLTANGGEPYIVSKMPKVQNDFFGTGRAGNFAFRPFPLVTGLRDAVRIGKFLTSTSGISFILAQNFLGNNSKSVFVKTDNEGKPIYNTTGQVELQQSRQRYRPNYNPLSTLSSLINKAGTSPIVKIKRDEPNLELLDQLGGSFSGGEAEYKPAFSLRDSFAFAPNSETAQDPFGYNDFKGTIVDVVGGNLGVPTDAKKYYGNGDAMTLTQLFTADSLDVNTAGKTGMIVSGSTNVDYLSHNIDEEKVGSAFYFKDLRDNKYVFFRAYIEGLTENISPSYTSHNYIGRSEPVYTYERAEREINFTLKLVAQTKQELEFLYVKMEKLTSMCYPEYQSDDYGNRMKPPLAKLRYGEYFGKTNKEVMGYIKSLSYSVDNSATYETDPKTGRVPKHLNVTIGYQVIHDKAPHMGMTQKFYGINQ
jgi:hypothetical protein